MKIFENKLREGNFTSSEIVRLFGKTMNEYVSECNMERRLGRSIADESNARPLAWGRLVELRVHDILPTSYRYSSDVTIQHPEIPFWCGSPDGEKFDEGKTVTDIKCPMTLKSFCQFADCKNINEIRDKHKDGEKYYWQLVSNSILTNSKYAELIVYVPYKSELEEVRDLAHNFIGNPNKVAWIGFAEDNELPHLPDGGYYKNLNIFRFEVPQSDKDELTEKVKEAGKLLQPQLLTA